MEEEFSVEDLVVAQILGKLPWLMWDADHRPPFTHNLRWGARKKRSTPTPASAPTPPGPPLPHLHAAEKLRRAADLLAAKPSEATTAAGAAAHPAAGSGAPAKTPPSLSRPATSCKAARPEASQGDQDALVRETPEKSAAAPETSSPQTPLDFCPSAEEQPDAKASAHPPSKKPRLKHEELSKQVDQLRSIGRELQKEAAEARTRRETLAEKNLELKEMRVKLKEAGHHLHHRQQQRQQQERDHHIRHESRLDLLPTGPVRPSAAALAQQQQQYQQAWPQHWLTKPIFIHQLEPGFSVHPSAAAVGQQDWNWTVAAAAHTWMLDGDKGGCHTSTKVLDLNSSAVEASELESPPQRGNYYCLQQQQVEQRKSSPEEQRAARKRRIETIQKRRNAAVPAAASGFSFR